MIILIKKSITKIIIIAGLKNGRSGRAASW
jgi:hypothetical protein